MILKEMAEAWKKVAREADKNREADRNEYSRRSRVML
jgi:hypothetical protein